MIYTGKVTRLMNFGDLLLEISCPGPGEGLGSTISQLAKERVEKCGRRGKRG